MKVMRFKRCVCKKVESALVQTRANYLLGKKYDGSVRHNGGRPVEIVVGSLEEHILADGKEDGMSNADALDAINDYREEKGKSLFGKNAVEGALKRMCTKIVAVNKQNHGSDDPESDWSRARCNFVKQLLIRTGEITIDDLKKEYGCENNIPAWFHPLNVTPLPPDAVSWFDETHKDCCVSDHGGKVKRQYLFKRDKNGNYDVMGEFGKAGTERTFKYNSQCRLALGCAVKVDRSTNQRTGYRLLPFDYTKKTMKSKTEWDGLNKCAISHIKLTGTSDWKSDGREPGILFKEDPTSCIGLGNNEKAREKALLDVGIQTLADLAALSGQTQEIKNILQKMPLTTGKKPSRIVGESSLRKYITQCSSSCLLDGPPPVATNFLDAPNPYKARYEEKWESEIRKSKFHKNSCCVTDLVEHMMTSSSDFFRDTIYDGKWYLYHDALILMTEKGCVQWMKTKQVSELDTRTYYECWLLPQLGLNADIARYGGRPVGNSPEFMPWDASLNRDIHETVRRHCVMSRATLRRQGLSSQDDSRHFSMATPELAAETYKRLLHPITGVAPTSKRILEDVSGVWLAMNIVCEQKGVYVPGLAERSGRHFIRGSGQKEGRGGSRKKGVHSLAHQKRKVEMNANLKAIRAVERKMREVGSILSRQKFVDEIVHFDDKHLPEIVNTVPNQLTRQDSGAPLPLLPLGIVLHAGG